MLEQIKMPSMGATMEEGVVIGWKVKEGSQVKTGDILLELESDKSTFDFESPCDGVVRKIVANEGDVVPVQQTIAIIGDADDEIPVDWLKQGACKESPVAEQEPQVVVQQDISTVPTRTRGIKISPRARKLAEKLGVNIATVTGTGPSGRIESSDIEKITQKDDETSEFITFTSTRKQINKTVTRSKQQIPHFYVQTIVDMTNVIAYRQRLIDDGEKISYNAILMKAIAKAIEVEPVFNCAFSDEGLLERKGINVGLAIETSKGVVIGVVDNVDKDGIPELSAKIRLNVDAARNERFNELKMDGACMTISNLGQYRVEAFLPIIHPGESAILGIGSISDRPVVKEGKIVIQKNMPMTFCIDHRIADGALAARFLEAMCDYLENLG
jgi:pyruvate dehydrogenase E2 component (dihydrolipoamide acetyltransferase)